MRRIVSVALLIGILAAIGLTGCGQIATPAAKPAFPEKGKPMTLIVPFAAGGGTDVTARLMAAALEKQFNTTISVTNVTGAGSQVGLTELAKAKPDGYTIGATNLPTTITVYVNPDRKPAFGRKDLQPIALQVLDPGVIAVRNDSPYQTMDDFITAAKQKPGQLKVATSGILSAPHLTVLRTQQVTGARFAIVHFEGASPGLTAVMGGHIDAAFSYVGDIYGPLKSKQVRPIGVMDKKESKYLPGVKTMEAQGYPVYDYNSRGLSAPAGVAAEIASVMSAAVKKAMDSDEMKAKMDEMGLAQEYTDQTQFAAYWNEQEKTLIPLVEEARKAQ